MKLRLAPDVFYRLYDGNTLLYKTGLKKVYLFNASAKEILDCFAEFSSIENCVKALQMKYALLAEQAEGISAFAEQLVSLGILAKENTLIEERDNAEVFFKDRMLSEGRLYSVLFELTFRCNEKCRHCYCVTDDKEELTTEEVKRVLDELYDMNVLEITFTGGDLFVRKDTFEILEYAYSKRFLISIFTNGIALSDTDILRLKSYHLKAIHFSIYSHIPEKHDYFTQVPGSFEKTTDVMKKCILIGIPVNVKTTAMAYNYDDVEGMLSFARELGATIQVGMSVNAKNDGDLSPTKLRIESVEKYARMIKLVSENIELHCSEDYLEFHGEREKICGAGSRALSINPYGDVFPCNALLLKCGNIREQTLKEIWEKSLTLNKIRTFEFEQIKGCENCPDMNYCNFCPGAALTETGDPLKRYDEACNLMKAKKLANNL